MTASCARSTTPAPVRVDAIATAPINKLAFSLAGLPWKGHTDLLAHLCGASRVAMLFYARELIVVLATVHVPLRDVPGLLTREVMHDTIALTAAAMPGFGIASPRIAVAGLNPHAGEGGLLGGEEGATLLPALADARAAGIDVRGPFPADTVFTRAIRGEFDVVIACYHDQGLIPVKLLSFGRAVNVTIGLPIVRTSVDHGTAFDIAGQGRRRSGKHDRSCPARVAARHVPRDLCSILVCAFVLGRRRTASPHDVAFAGDRA